MVSENASTSPMKTLPLTTLCTTEITVLGHCCTMGDTKACTQIELAISDAEMIHISGTTTAHEMWSQLSLAKESKGQLGALATHWAIYRATAEGGFDIINHIFYL